jgi:hypothetical protein
MGGFFNISENELTGLEDKVAIVTGRCFNLLDIPSYSISFLRCCYLVEPIYMLSLWPSPGFPLQIGIS